MCLFEAVLWPGVTLIIFFSIRPHLLALLVRISSIKYLDIELVIAKAENHARGWMNLDFSVSSLSSESLDKLEEICALDLSPRRSTRN